MSHIATIKLQIVQKNEQDLINALQKQYGKEGVEVHDSPVALKGMDTKNKSAHLVVRKDTVALHGGHGWNDLGFRRLTDGTYDTYVDQAEVPVDQITQEYAALVAERKLKSEGYNVQRQQLDNGYLRLYATDYR